MRYKLQMWEIMSRLAWSYKTVLLNGKRQIIPDMFLLDSVINIASHRSTKYYEPLEGTEKMGVNRLCEWGLNLLNISLTLETYMHTCAHVHAHTHTHTHTGIRYCIL